MVPIDGDLNGDHDDDAWIAEIRNAVAEAHDFPQEAVEAAKAVYQMRRVDEELEMLTMLYDSLVDHQVAVRDAGFVPARAMTFQSGELSLEVEVNAASVLGQVVPPQSASITVLTVNGFADTCETDDFGCFSVSRPPARNIRLTCRTTSAQLSTGWISI